MAPKDFKEYLPINIINILIMKIMAAVEKLDGSIKAQIKITGPKIGKKDSLNE